MGTGTFSANSESAVLNSPIKKLFYGLDPWAPGASSTTSGGTGYYGKNGISYAPSSITNNNPLLSYNGIGSVNQNNSTNPTPDPDQNQTTTSGWDLFNTSMNGINGLVNAGLGINNAVQGWMNYRENKKLINKQMQAIDEQIAASKEYRQQRADEIARLNRVRNNTTKAFNTGTTITRSY